MRYDAFRAGTIIGLGVFCSALISGCASSTATSSPLGSAPLGNAPLSGAQGSSRLHPSALHDALFPSLAGPRPPASRGRGWLSGDAKAGRNVVYSGDYGNSLINIYPIKGKNPAPIGQITTGIQNPERLFVDSKHKLYVTNSTTVTVYKPGKTSPSLTISNGISDPTGLTVGPDGTVYVANVNNDTITEYPAGQTSPSMTLTIPGTPENLAIDAASNLFVSFFGSPSSNVLEYAPGATTGTNLGLNIGSPGPLEVDSSDNVLIIDSALNDLDVFPAGQTQPSSQVHYADGSPFELALGKGQKKVYASVETNASVYFDIEWVAYPKLSTPKEQIETQPYQSFESWPLAVSPDGEP